ncbi:hypothetical protein C8Q77DRAFT_1052818 [Trametes polyzona]|nr:hypothetical protein C8Q77DRAFT_1052818 [Trametes polyzona]
MAKASAASEKPTKLAKKKSQQDLKADAPVKAKKAKATEETVAPAAAEPSSSKAKKDKKGKSAAKDSEAAPAPTPAKAKADKKKQEPVAEPAPVNKAGDAEDKKKRKSVAVEDKTEESAEKSKKKRKSSAAAVSEETTAKAPAKDTAKVPASESKAAKKGKSTPVVQEQPAQSQKDGKKSKAKPAPKAPSPSPAEEDKDENEEGEEEVDEEEKEFYGFSSDDDDSSDEEMVDEIPGIDVGKLPTIAKDDETVKRRLEKAKRKPTEDRGVIYLGRIPHGFFEDQMRAYFSQFGTVTRLRLSRNKKTGRSKHYAFIEFDSSSVAQIVAETMDNYLLMGHILTCKVIPKDQVHPELWVGANRKWRPVPRDRVARVAHNKPRTEEEQSKAERRLLKRQEQRKRKLEEAGINYDFEAVAYVSLSPDLSSHRGRFTSRDRPLMSPAEKEAQAD